jgi:hypothetical protein
MTEKRESAFHPANKESVHMTTFYHHDYDYHGRRNAMFLFDKSQEGYEQMPRTKMFLCKKSFKIPAENKRMIPVRYFRVRGSFESIRASKRNVPIAHKGAASANMTIFFIILTLDNRLRNK